MSSPSRCQSVPAAALLALACVVSLGCQLEGEAPASVADEATVRQPIVYGQDDRMEVYELADPEVESLAKARAAALVLASRVEVGEGGVTLDAPTLGEAAHLCAGQPFAEQPSAASCSAVLVDQRLALTAGHCVRGLSCTDFRLVTGYYASGPGELNPLQESDIYQCEVILHEAVSDPDSAERVDFAWLLLDRPVTAIAEPLELSPRERPLAPGETVTLIGFSAGLPAKVDLRGTVVDPRSETLDYFVTDSDAFQGNSGSAVYDSNHRLVGVQGRGGPDFLPTDQGCQISFREEPYPEYAQEEVTYAFRAAEELCEVAPSLDFCCTQGDCNRKLDVDSGCQLAPSAGRSARAWLWLLGGVLLLGVWGRRRRRVAPRSSR